jgi:biotin carboxyl carrier protein
MQHQDFQVFVNSHFEFKDLSPQTFDVAKVKDAAFHVLKNNVSYRAELVEADFPKKELSIRINGSLYEVKLADVFDQLVSKLGLAKVSSHAIKEVRAPMPGLTLEVSVRAGQAVSKGDALLILEAMKMENVIKSPGDGVVKKIHVEKGDVVEKGQLLLEME